MQLVSGRDGLEKFLPIKMKLLSHPELAGPGVGVGDKGKYRFDRQ